MTPCLQMLSEVIANFNESLLVEDEQYVLVVDLFIVRPELQLQVTGDRRALHYTNPATA